VLARGSVCVGKCVPGKGGRSLKQKKETQMFTDASSVIFDVIFFTWNIYILIEVISVCVCVCVHVYVCVCGSCTRAHKRTLTYSATQNEKSVP